MSKLRILIYGNRKLDGDCYWDASTPENEAGAFLSLFKLLDESWSVYADIMEPHQSPTFPEGHVPGCRCEACLRVTNALKLDQREQKRSEDQRRLYQEAKNGDARAAAELLRMRRDWEYENFRFGWVETVKGEYAPREEWGSKGKPCNDLVVVDAGDFALTYTFGHGIFHSQPHVYDSFDAALDKSLKRDRVYRELKQPKPPHPLVLDQYPTLKAYGDDEKALRLAAAQPFVTPKRLAFLRMQVCSTHRREQERFRNE
jgi:hypothetical protein